MEALQTYGPSTRALKQRRWLILTVKVLLWAILALAIRQTALSPGTQNLLILASAALLFLPNQWALAGLESRKILLHEQALEIQRGSFRRFIVFENLRHVHAVRGPKERMIALHLHTGDDTVSIRDMEGLAPLFTVISAHKPANVLIEMEDKTVDWGEPLPWMLLIGMALAGFGVWAGLA